MRNAGSVDVYGFADGQMAVNNIVNSGKSLLAATELFGQQIGKFQGVSFKLADLITSIDAADLLTLSAAWRLDQKLPANREIAQAKLFATEMLARVMGMYLAPLVVPLVLARYSGRPGHSTSGSPAFTRSKYDFRAS